MGCRPTLAFLQYGWLKAEDRTRRGRFAGHAREIFDAVLDTCADVPQEAF